MVSEFRLPDVGEGLTEAEIVTWHVQPGDQVKVNDVLCDIETAKSVVELPSPYAGFVQRLLVPEGETVEVGTPIISIGEFVEVPAESSQDPAELVEDPVELSEEHAETGNSPAETDNSRGETEKSAGTGENSGEPLTLVGYGSREAPVSRRRRVLAKPTARAAARDLGVDLADVVPSRADGVITAADLSPQPALGRHASGDGTTANGSEPHDVPRPLSREDREHREPVKGVRKQMAQAMVRSAFTAPHVTEWVTVDVTETTSLVERLKQRRELRDRRIGPLLVLARACLLAVRRTPIINSTWDEQAQQVVLKDYVNLGIAAATPRGLVVPNVKDADRLDIAALAEALDQLVATAREGRTPPADLSGGTFTITNVGSFGVDAGTPIINPGESAILCFGAIKRRPWVVGDEVVVRDVCTLSLSFDHRHIDGEAGSRFLADVAGILEDPATAVLF